MRHPIRDKTLLLDYLLNGKAIEIESFLQPIIIMPLIVVQTFVRIYSHDEMLETRKPSKTTINHFIY